METPARQPENSAPSSKLAPTSAKRGKGARLQADKIEILWARMTAIYGYRFTSNYGEDPAALGGETWSAALADLNGTQLATGLRACRDSADVWPPTLPEFRARCLGVVSLAVVKYELKQPIDKMSLFTRHVSCLLDRFALRQSDERGQHRILSEAYEIACFSVLAGEDLRQHAEVTKLDQVATEELYMKLHMEKLRELEAG